MAGQTYFMQRLRGSGLGQILTRKKLEEIAVVSESPKDKWCPSCGALVPAAAPACPVCGLTREAMEGPTPPGEKATDDGAPPAKNELYQQLVESGRLVIERTEGTSSPTRLT